MAVTLVNTSEAQSQPAVTTLTTPGVSLTAGNFSLVVLRAQSNLSSGTTIADTATNSYDGPIVGDGNRMVIWYKAGCLGNGSNAVTVTFPSGPFCHVVAAQYTEMTSHVSVSSLSLNQGVGPTTISLNPSGPGGFANQLTIATADVGGSAHSTISGFTSFGSGTYGPGAGSDDQFYQVNTTHFFDGSQTVTASFSGADPTLTKSMLIAVFSPSPTTPDAILDSSTPCCNSATGPGTNAGPVESFVNPAWTPVCTGGGDLYAAATDPTDPESWDDPSERTADTWLELRLAQYPAFAGSPSTAQVTTLRYASQPFADTGSFKDGRLISLSRSRRACTDPDGNYESGRVTAVFADGDGYFRSLLEQGTTTEYFVNREATIYTATETARRAGNKRIRFRGWISNVKLLPQRRIQLEIADVIGSQMSGFNLDKVIGVPITTAEHPDAPEATLKLIYPILGGERSDLGAVDAAGNSVEKGLEPAIDCGDYDITGSEPAPTLADPPVITSSGVVGTSGEHTYYYAASLITPYGESLLSNVVTIDGAASRNASNYNWLEGTYDKGASSPFNKVRIWRSEDATTFNLWLDEANYFTTGSPVVQMFGYADGAAPYPTITRDELDTPKSMASPGLSQANTNTNLFAWMLVSIGYGYEILDVFASDLSVGAEPRRVKMDASVYDVEIIRPQDASWPHADPWREFGGIRQFGFYMRGARLNHHRSGTVTVAVTVCGPHDDSDLLVNQCGTLQLWFLNEHVVKGNGTGYRTGDWGPLEAYANSDTILNKTQFDAAQTITAGWIGGLGYLQEISIHEPITVREVLRRWTVSFGWRYAADHHGRIRPVVIDNTADPTTGRLLRERMEIRQNDDDTLAWDEVLNRIEYDFHLDADTNSYRALRNTAINEISIAAHVPGGVVGAANPAGVKQQTRELWGQNDPTTAADSQQRELVRRRRRPRYVKDTVDLMALDYEIGDSFRRTHSNGMGQLGDVETPMIALAFEEDYDRNTVTIEMQDLGGIFDDAESELAYLDPDGLDVAQLDDTGEYAYMES